MRDNSSLAEMRKEEGWVWGLQLHSVKTSLLQKPIAENREANDARNEETPDVWG